MKFIVQQKFTNSRTPIHIEMKKVLTQTLTLTGTDNRAHMSMGGHGRLGGALHGRHSGDAMAGSPGRAMPESRCDGGGPRPG